MAQRKINIILLVLFLLISSLTQAYAADFKDIKITTLDIGIMPEYDTSDVLVLYSINYVNTASSPFIGEFRFPVPKDTKNNIVIETANNNDKYSNVKVEDKGEYAEFVWQPTQPLLPNTDYPIHLEYYYNSIPGAGDKTFKYLFTPNVAVEKLNIQFLAPLKSTNFKTEPASKLLGKDEQGFSVYGVDYPTPKAGEKIELQVSYTKSDPNPSFQAPGGAGTVQNQAPPVQQNANKKPVNKMLVFFIFLILLGVIGIIALKIFSGRSSQNEDEIDANNEDEASEDNEGNADTVENVHDDKKQEEKRKIRKKLLNGEISEETYKQLLKEIEEDNN